MGIGRTGLLREYGFKQAAAPTCKLRRAVRGVNVRARGPRQIHGLRLPRIVRRSRQLDLDTLQGWAALSCLCSIHIHADRHGFA
eukprot:1161528-Pelagomonas_calceolata.AAC.5